MDNWEQEIKFALIKFRKEKTMAINIEELARRKTTLSPVMENRQKATTKEIMELFPDGFTVVAFDLIPSKKGDGEYPVLNIEEDNSIFFSGGTVLKRVFTEIAKAFDGDITRANYELRKQGGLKLKLGVAETKNGNEVITAEVL